MMKAPVRMWYMAPMDIHMLSELIIRINVTCLSVFNVRRLQQQQENACVQDREHCCLRTFIGVLGIR